MLKQNYKLTKGFTLIETLIYVGIFSVVALSLTGILWNTLRVNSNQQAANEVDENLRYIMSVLGEKVRSSTVVDTATSSTLVLKNASYEDITFSVTGDVLYLQEGSGASVALTSNKVKVDSLNFTKIEMAGAKDGVRVDITLSYNSDKAELAFSKNLISSINRVAAITFDSDLLPDTNNLYSIGADNPRWKNGYFSGDLYVTGNETLTGNLAVDTSVFYVDSANDKVGIGTASPGSRFTVQASATNTTPFAILNPSGSARLNVLIDSNNKTRLRLYDETDTLTTLFNSSGSSYFNGGGLGIGTTTPAEALEVNGNIKLSGATATYKITNVATPTASSDVATKGYVDAAGTTYTQYVQYFATSGVVTWTNPNGAASTTISVIVVGGGGGGGGAANNATNGTAGSAGGTSSFGALASATGGSGGAGGPNYAVAADGGAGYHQGSTGIAGQNTYEPGGNASPGGIGFQGCGNGGHGAGGERSPGAGGGSGNVRTYYGVVTGASYKVTIGAGGAGGASSGLSSPPGGTDGAPGCVILYWWDN
jgi:type II secretory pathway pseudopilin PulG